MRHLLLIAAIVATLPLSAATEPNPSVRQRELIEKLLVVTDVDGSMPQVMDSVFGHIQKQFLDEAIAKGNDPADLAEAQELFENFRARASRIDFNGLLHEAYVVMYAKYFTEAELSDLNAFYATPTGRKTIQVMPQLMNDGMQAGIKHIGPKIEEIMKQVGEDGEKKRPWRRTMADIRSVSTALEAYALDHEELYPTGDYAYLKKILTPDYLKTFPETDMWGHEYAYVVSPDRRHYRVISSGADSNFEWDSRRIVPAKEGEDIEVRYRERLEDDLIFADGSFIQLPVPAKPKE